MTCPEGIFINAGQLRVPCKSLADEHEMHLGLYKRPGELNWRTITWSGPVGATVIDPPEVEPWSTRPAAPPKKPWEKPTGLRM